jgi:hypothetical protein
MAIQSASAKLYTGIRCWVVDKNISAALTSSFTLGNQRQPSPVLVEGVPTVFADVLAFKLLRAIADLVVTPSVLLTNQRLKTFGGGNNVITPGTPRVINNTNNWKVNASIVCKFPTYFRIDVDKLDLPQGTTCTVSFEEDWIRDGVYLESTKASSAAIGNFFTFRTPWKGASFINSTFTLPNRTALRIKQLASSISSTASFTALAIFNPGKFAALFAGVSQIVPNAVKTAVFSGTLQSAFSSIPTITRIKQLASDISNGTFSVSLPEFDIVIEYTASLASEFTKTVSSANSRIRFIFNQALSGNFQFFSDTLNSRRRNTTSTVNAVSSMTSALNVTITQPVEIANPFSGETGFGRALAFDGTNIVVGAPSYDVNGTNNGIAYVFSSVTGALTRTINNPNASQTVNFTDDEFGYAVAASGNYAVIGAPQEDGSNTSFKGRAYVIDMPTGAIVYTLNNPNDATDYFTGASVAISDTYIVIGQNRESVLVYSLSTGQLLRTLSVDSDLANRFFTVDIYGDNIIVGTRRVTVNFTDTYRLYQYSASTGALIRIIDNPNPFSTQHGDAFGSAVAIYGNYAVVGAPGEDIANTDAGSNVGKAYIFNLTNGNLVQTFDNPNPQGFDQFGKSVDINHRYAVVADFNQVHIFNILDGSLEATVAVTGASDVAIYGNKFAVSTNEFTGKVRVFSF